MDVLTIDQIPQLRQPILILAFAGWNDAGGAATTAAKFLSQHLKARKFASIDPEEFYNFTEQRPLVRLKEGLHREIIWPENDFYYRQNPDLPRDVIIGVGVEPHLKWRTYVKAIFQIIELCQVSMVTTLGALLAEVVHSRPVRVTGSSTDPALSKRLRLSTSRYEGPTGIVGVLHDACRKQGLPAVSLWANIPHYISAPSNPKGALALVRRVGALLNRTFDLRELEATAKAFDEQIAEILANDSAMADYVHQLEENEGREEEVDSPLQGEEELPSIEGLAEEVEQFLRQHRKGQEEQD